MELCERVRLSAGDNLLGDGEFMIRVDFSGVDVCSVGNFPDSLGSITFSFFIPAS